MSKMNKLLIGLFLLLPIVAVQAQDASILPEAAWTTTTGELWLASRGLEPLQLAEAGACCAVFSPGGTRLAYVSTNTNGQSLVLLDTANPTHPLQTISSDSFPAGSLLGFLSWQGEDLLWLNTFTQPDRPDVKLLESNWGLWVIRVDTGRVTTISDQGRGGVAFPSPDGQVIAWVYPGRYQEIPAVISLYNSAGDQLGTYEFPAVSSGTHLPWLPHITWVEDTLWFALPDPDILYAFDSATPVSQLIELRLDGTTTVLGEAQIVYPAKVVWSPDGRQVAYITPAESASQNVVIKALESGEGTVIREQIPLGSEVLLWGDWLVVSLLGEGIILWSPDREYSVPDVFGVATTQTNGLVLAKRDQLVYWQDGDETLIARGISGLDMILAHGLLPIQK
jgi:hypothetical protein